MGIEDLSTGIEVLASTSMDSSPGVGDLGTRARYQGMTVGGPSMSTRIPSLASVGTWTWELGTQARSSRIRAQAPEFRAWSLGT